MQKAAQKSPWLLAFRAVDRSTRSFWILVGILFGAALYFGVNAESQRRAAQQAKVALATGQIVRLGRVIDGDTVTVLTEAGDSVPVRILGIKAFDAKGDKDPTTRFGVEAVRALGKALEGKPVRVLLNDPPRDSHGRTIAQLYVDDEDVALSLVERGVVLVYSVYPFPAMSIYLQAQAAARADRKGLWADAETAHRAEWLMADWRRRAE